MICNTSINLGAQFLHLFQPVTQINAEKLANLNAVGTLLYESGELQGAEKLYRRVINGFKERANKNHLYASIVFNNLASVLKAQNKYFEAEHYFRLAIELQRQYTAPKDQTIVSTINNFVDLLYDLGRYPEATKLLLEALAKVESIHGRKHLEVINLKETLARVLTAQELQHKALPLLEEVVQVKYLALGYQHLDTLRSMHNLGELLLATGNLQASEHYIRKCLNGFQATLGRKDLETLATMNNLAKVLLNLQRFEEAEDLLREVFALRKELQGNNELDTLLSMNNLAVFYSALGRVDEALELCREALSNVKKLLINVRNQIDNSELLKCIEMLNHTYELCLKTLKNPVRIKELLLSTTKRLNETYGPNHKRTRRAQARLAKFLKNSGQSAP